MLMSHDENMNRDEDDQGIDKIISKGDRFPMRAFYIYIFVKNDHGNWAYQSLCVIRLEKKERVSVHKLVGS